MFLKTAPPVVAVHSEWRSGKSLSLPLNFNDSASDSDFVSSSGTPIPHKVQMIIDCLCNTQSSDMSSEVNTTAQSALSLPKPSCGGHKSCHKDTPALSQRGGTDSGKLHSSSFDATEDSDSDDSVDRGIEEAIQEYLKEKVDPKYKMDTVESPGQTPKVHQGGHCISSAQVMHSTKVLSSRNIMLTDPKGIHPLVALKKKKNKVQVNTFGKKGVAMALLTRAPPFCDTSSCMPQVEVTPPSLGIKVNEEDVMDSSSDDGIEEAIQTFQKEENKCHKGLRYFQLKEALDSSSDDGIEEAIQNYQQERQKEKERKLDLKQSCLMADHITVKPLKKISKRKNKKKNAVKSEEIKCASPKSEGPSLSILPTCCTKASRDSLYFTSVEKPQHGQLIHSTLTVNTTAELMCAEAILDISKTVMPAAFVPTLDLASSPTTETPSFLPTAVSLHQYEKSDESSVDSEDGIEQEIRKFLELKAKLHEQAATADYAGVSTVTETPQHIKVEEDQNKSLRLSFSRKRKWKDDGKNCKKVIADIPFKEEPLPLKQNYFSQGIWHMSSPNSYKNSNPKQSSPNHSTAEGFTSMNKSSSYGISTPTSFMGSERNYSSDKSSSLDSDEDLDAAIKDLLKTKKKVKKNVRDMKLKAQKSHKQLPGTDTLKKHKYVKDQKLVIAAKLTKPNAIKSITKLSIPRQNKGAKPKPLKSQKDNRKPKYVLKEEQGAVKKMSDHGVQSKDIDEDSSSVDSDDSIEQEIRRFLAEKSKGSSSSVATLKQESADRAAFSTFGVKNVQIEELQTKSSDFTRASLSIKSNEEKQTDYTALNLKGPMSAVASYCSLEEDGMGVQLQETTLHECRNISLDTDKVWAQKVIGKFTDRSNSEPFVINVTGPEEHKVKVQHQNLFLLTHDNYSLSTAREKSADMSSSMQNKTTIPLIEVVSTVCASPHPIGKHFLSSSSETLMIAKDSCQDSPFESRSDSFDLYSWESNGQWDQPRNLTANTRHTSSSPAHLSQQLPAYPSHLSCVPLPHALSQPHAGTSLMHLHKNQASIAALASHKSSQLQFKNTQNDVKLSEGREEEKERCIDETDVESGDERTVKRPHQCSQSLSTCIDPGVFLSHYIAFSTDEWNQKFKHNKQRVLKCPKRKLDFVSTSVIMKLR